MTLNSLWTGDTKIASICVPCNNNKDVWEEYSNRFYIFNTSIDLEVGLMWSFSSCSELEIAYKWEITQYK